VSSFAGNVGGFVALLGAAVIIAILAERIRIPAAVALVAVGACIHVPLPFAFGNTLLFVFLPPLIFEAAWNLDLGALRRTAWRIAGLAIPGTLATAGIVAAALAGPHVLPLGSALLVGAIVAATDPVAVVSAFRRVTVPADIRTLVEGESLANDGVALVLFGFALSFAAGAPLAVGSDIAVGLLAVVGGCAIGIAAGLLCAAALRVTDALEHEVTVTIVLAYATYVAASSLNCSGIFATAASAVALRAAIVRFPTAIVHADDVDRVWSSAAFIANAMVFLATGLLIEPQRVIHEPALVIVTIAAIWAARLLLAFAAARRRADRITVFFAGMRGALPLALALALPDGLPGRAQIIDATFAVVLVTIIALGAPLVPLLGRLYGSNALVRRNATP
jgi:CPA1 family monovalent cation:H+ antiporter